MAPYAAICLAGPTGAGKTALAIKLASELGGEIVNADSRQLYADLPIITAQPDATEKTQAPHHLYGILDCRHKISVGKWLDLAQAKCAEISARGNIPIFAGGTGFYFEALLHGIAPMPAVPAPISEKILAELRAVGPEAMYARLAAVDPEYAGKIHPHDRQRIGRALEVFAASGKPFSWWHAQGRQRALAAGPFFAINASLAWLEPRLLARIEKMLAQGALEEAARAREKCGRNAYAFNGIGAAELMDYLDGSCDLDECKRRWIAATRAYAKRQLTWMRCRSGAQWLETGAEAQALELARQQLAAMLPWPSRPQQSKRFP